MFVHVAARVVRKWEFEEAVEARQMSVWDAPHGTSVLRLGEEREGWGGRVGGQCCAI